MSMRRESNKKWTGFVIDVIMQKKEILCSYATGVKLPPAMLSVILYLEELYLREIGFAIHVGSDGNKLVDLIVILFNK